METLRQTVGFTDVDDLVAKAQVWIIGVQSSILLGAADYNYSRGLSWYFTNGIYTISGYYDAFGINTAHIVLDHTSGNI